MRQKALFILLFLAVLLAGFMSARAQKGSLPIAPRRFSDRAISQTVRDDKAFHYNSGPVITPPNAWQRFWNWLWHHWGRVLNRPGTGIFIQYFLLALSVSIVVFAIVRLMGMQGIFFISKKSEEVSLRHEELSNNIYEIPFDKRIEECVHKKQYRAAVRLLYLQTLRHLSDRSLIDWKKEKTNADYVREIKEPLNQPFGKLTHEFEYVWYGEFALGEQQFFTLKKSFSAFADGVKSQA